MTWLEGNFNRDEFTAIRVSLLSLVRRKLHCPRNTVHINLFISFILRAVMALIRDLLMSDSVGLRGDTVHYADGYHFASGTSVVHVFSSSSAADSGEQ